MILEVIIDLVDYLLACLCFHTEAPLLRQHISEKANKLVVDVVHVELETKRKG